MDQQFTPPGKPTLEEVRRRFDQWRESRKQRAPIPDSLWAGAASLCADHSIYRISKSLHLNYNALKRRVCCSHSERFPESSAFVELALKSTLPEAECLLEMEAAEGAKLTMHIKGGPCLDPLAFMEAFFRQAR